MNEIVYTVYITQVSEVQAKLRAKVDLLTMDLGPDSNYCLLLPGQEGRTGLWLQPDYTLQDYMEGVSRNTYPSLKVFLAISICLDLILLH